MSRFRPYDLHRQGTSVFVSLSYLSSYQFLTDPGYWQQTGPPPRERTSPYFLLFATDADRELKIPIDEAATYRTLREGRPARLRKCKVMITMFDHVYWFMVTTRHSDDGARNNSIDETMGFPWNGPLTVMRLERRGGNTPIGILTTEHRQAAIAAVERYATGLIPEPLLTHESQVPGYHV